MARTTKTTATARTAATATAPVRKRRRQAAAAVDVVALVEEMPGQHAGTYRQLLGAPKRTIGRALRKAAAKGGLAVTTVGRNKIYAPAEGVVQSRSRKAR